MCLICVELERDRMTVAEAYRALGEMVQRLDPKHVEEVRERLRQAEAETTEEEV